MTTAGVLDVYSGNMWGGVEAHLVRTARCSALSPGIRRAFALCFEGRLARELRGAGAKVIALPSARMLSPRSVMRAQRELERAIRGDRIDVLITHAPWSHILFGPIARRCGVRLVHYCHDVPNPKSLMDLVASRIRPDLVVCNSRFTEEAGAWMYPGVPRFTSYSPLPATAAPHLDTRAALRARHGAPDGDRVILFVSRLEPYKGHMLFLQALHRLRSHPGWTCWIAGGPQRPSEREYERRLVQEVQRLGLGGRIAFLGQIEDVDALMRASDIHCQTNVRAEPFGLVFVEALRAGLPVVATDMGGAREIVDDSCGRRVAPDARAIAQALRDLIDDSGERARLSRGAPIRAAKLCDPSNVIPSFADRIARLLAERGSAHADGGPIVGPA